MGAKIPYKKYESLFVRAKNLNALYSVEASPVISWMAKTLYAADEGFLSHANLCSSYQAYCSNADVKEPQRSVFLTELESHATIFFRIKYKKTRKDTKKGRVRGILGLTFDKSPGKSLDKILKQKQNDLDLPKDAWGNCPEPG